MKKQIKNKFKLIFLMFIFLGISYFSTAQNGDPPPPNGGNGGENNSVVGGGAPIGSGSLILLLLASAYGTAKYRKRRGLHDAKSKNQHRNKQKGKHYISPSLKTFLLIAGLIVLSFNAQKVLADTFTVTTLNDAGNGSLRWAIEQANATAGQHTINFDVNGTITLVTALPAITRDYTIIDASSQWQGVWPDGSPGIEINGISLPITSVGIYLNGASHCEIRGLHINNFSKNQCMAILTFNSADNNIIGGIGGGMRNVITNSYSGIHLRSNSNTVIGNYIGVASDGLTAAPNNQNGVYINQSYYNTIGGTTEAERNVISGNTLYGIYIGGQYTNVKGNYIGVNKNGTAALPNGFDGIIITEPNNTIGGTEAGAGNIISGNTGDGVYILGGNNNTVVGNYLGTDKNGTGALGNGNAGVYIAGGADENTIGGATVAARNIISANSHSGVMITGSTQNQVLGNYIGTDVNGTADLGNTYYGVVLFGGAQANIIGGTVQGSGNVISGNNASGVAIRETNTNNNHVQGNYIGTTADGISDRGNTEHGVYIGDGAKYNTIGGSIAAARNIISGNDYSGVAVENNGTNGNVISGNTIGLNVQGNLRRNIDYGVYVGDAADGTIIGGNTENERNIISGNDGGIQVGRGGYAEVSNTIIKNNFIGTDPTGQLNRGNSSHGISVAVPSTNTQIINNLISGNSSGGSGINIEDGPNTIKGNTIGSNYSRTYALPNISAGIRVDCENNMIGGTTGGDGNFIAWNGYGGIWIKVSNNTVYGNTICHNDYNGIKIAGYSEHADNNIIGGTNSGEANSIHHNTPCGIQVYGENESQDYFDFRYTDYNRISGNSIYDNIGLGIDLVASGNGPGIAPHISAPVISSTSLNANMLHIEGTGAGASATLEIFLTDDASSGEGKTYLGSLTTDASKAAGDFSGNLDLSGFDISAGDNIVATTTHTDNNTSEFSALSIITEANTMISAQTGNWNSTTTWLGGQIPGSSNDVIVYEGHTVTVNDSQSCQKFTLQSGSELILMAGLPTASIGYDLAENSTVNYANATKGDQTIEAAPNYGNLTLSGNGNKTANDDLNILGNMEMTNTAVFLSGNTTAIEGNLFANGTAQFNPGGNTTINGSFTLVENSSGQNNALLTINGPVDLQDNAVLVLGNNMDVNSNINIGAGATLNGGSALLYIAGNWTQQGTWNPGTSTVIFDKTNGNQGIASTGLGSEIQVGSGTVSERNYPFNNYRKNNKSQMLYLGSDIGISGLINGIQLNISLVSPEGFRNFKNFTVRLNHTSESNWYNKGRYADMTDAVTVLSQAVYTLPSETGWFTIDFDTPFSYDNTNNVIVEIVWGSNPNYTTSAYEVLTTDYPYDEERVLYGYSNSETPPNFDFEKDHLPNMKFMFLGTNPSEYYNLHVNKSALENELTIASDLLINNDLEVMSGNFSASYNVLVLGNTILGSTSKSSSQLAVEPDHSLTVNGDLSLNNTGEIVLHDSDDPLTNPGMLLPKQAVLVEGNGQCTAQRYYQGNQWHLVSSPMADALSEIFIGNVLQYHTENDNSWNDITSVSHPLNPAQGYSLWASAAESVLAEFAGTPNAGIQTFDFVSSGGEGFGWNMVGNPYTATLDWDEVSIPENLDATIYLWDPEEGESGNYLYYLPGAPSNTASQYVAMAQGFFVHCNNVAGGTLNITPDAMTSEPATFYKSEKQNENTLVYQVENYPSTKGSVRFMNDASEAFDPLLDAYRMTPGNGIPMIYTESENIKMAVNSLPNLSDSRSVDLGFSVNVPGEYTLSFEGQDSFTDVPIYLEDKKADTLTDLTQQGNYSFVSEDGDDAARFTLLFGKSAGVPQNETGQRVSIFPNPSFGKVTVAGLESGALLSLSNLNGQMLIKDQILNTEKLQIDLSAYPAGVYFINVQFKEVSIFDKLILR